MSQTPLKQKCVSLLFTIESYIKLDFYDINIYNNTTKVCSAVWLPWSQTKPWYSNDWFLKTELECHMFFRRTTCYIVHWTDWVQTYQTTLWVWRLVSTQPEIPQWHTMLLWNLQSKWLIQFVLVIQLSEWVDLCTNKLKTVNLDNVS